MTVEMCALRKPAQNASNVFTIYIEWVPLLEGTVIQKFYEGTFHLYTSRATIWSFITVL